MKIPFFNYNHIDFYDKIIFQIDRYNISYYLC
jgi:hypothetical protein